ncbi:MAG: hydantoinase B/oxoprolinase family protein, partial [Actinomycetota bacterium]
GTHLPDITLVAPWAPEAGEIAGYVAARAHHSDVGGSRPGSMPSGSTEIFQEGLIIPPVKLAEAGVVQDAVLDLILANVRTPAVRRGDIWAQVASIALGLQRLSELAADYGTQAVMEGFRETIAYGRRRSLAAIAALPDGTHRAERLIEGDGVSDADVPVRVKVEIAGDEITIDFAGTSPAVPGNLNCPMSVTASACYFALKVALGADVPANAGTYSTVTITAPEACLVNARPPSAVVGGNVETSQAIADAVLSALSGATPVPAQGQGTMNNVVIGTPRWTYYETIGGGQGASSSGAGPSGVHAGMSNTLNTPIEALELEYPMRIERQQLLYGSGGNGRHRGGDGIERAVTVLEPATLSLLTDRRRRGPEGSLGGSGGRPGRNLLNGKDLKAKADVNLDAGDTLTVETPGGGGWGPVQDPTLPGAEGRL